MSNFARENFLGLLELAAKEGRQPTAWEVSPYGAAEIEKSAVAGELYWRPCLSKPDKFYGLSILERIDFPRWRVVLMAGHIPVGHFDLKEQSDG